MSKKLSVPGKQLGISVDKKGRLCLSENLLYSYSAHKGAVLFPYGMSYSGSIHVLGTCDPGSIPGIPTR